MVLMRILHRLFVFLLLILATSPLHADVAGCTTIDSAGLTAQPSTVNSAQTSTLFFSTAGAGPFTIQWYTGEVGDTNHPIVNAISTSIVVSPIATTSYWVRVSAPCGTQDGSVIVLVNGSTCTQVSFVSHPSFVSISPGASVTLTAIASGTPPISYQWYAGTSGNTSQIITNATSSSIAVKPLTTTTTYWLHASNSCNTVGVNSATAVVQLSASCPSPAITAQPLLASAGIGTSGTLKIAASGIGLHYQWYKGPRGNIATKVGGDSSTLLIAPVNVTTTYWVRVSQDCGSFIDSDAAVVTAFMTRAHAVHH
ncbi:MAG: hypothetical protein QOK37_879 [Thermoanaerobaculia bacterium]|jgi:hypothetical protein|nr:hypothetical protein [Thermoanaerobaculia bacterium]